MAGGSFAQRGQLYLHTLRHLKPGQLVWRAWRGLARPAAIPGATPPLRRARQALFESPAKPRTMLAADTFRLLNETHRVVSVEDWNHPTWPALWVYNLHYFDDLCGLDAAPREDWHRELMRRWIADNPVGKGRGWDAYPTSLRIVNWIKWVHAGPALGAEATGSLAAQARYLTRSIEWHLLANHLLANAKALVFAGCFFDGPEAQAWLQRGLAILEEQVEEQVLADGAHFERSPMYHAIVLEDFLDLVNVLVSYRIETELTGRLKALLPSMFTWLETMSHPDGGLAYFNDTTAGVASGMKALTRYASTLGIEVPSSPGSVMHPASGYMRLEAALFVAILDAGAVGPDYQPGHAHADTLSFELSFQGVRVLCNSGVSTYEVGAQRQLERSTPAHNTVSVDGADSSEVWASFRVARRAHPSGMEFEKGDGVRASASHDGYRRLRGAPLHRRELVVTQEHVTWVDAVTGSGEHEVRGHIPIHPDVACELVGNRFVLMLPFHEALHGEIAGDVSLRLEPGTFAEGFNLRRERQVLVWSWRGKLPCRVEVVLRAHAHPVPD